MPSQQKLRLRQRPAWLTCFVCDAKIDEWWFGEVGRICPPCRRWRRRNPKRRKELERKQRRKKREANPRRFRCRECGVDIIVVHGRSRKFCSRRCRNGWHGPRRTDRNRGLRQMDIRSTILGILRHGEWMSKRDILGAAPHLKPQSVSTTLGALAASGSISKRGNTRTMRYTRGTPCQTEP